MQPLFSQGRLADFLERRKQEIKKFVESRDADEVLKADEKWCQDLIEKFRLEPPEILKDDKDDKIEVKKPRYSKDEDIEILVHFKGNAELLQYLPSKRESVLPYAEIRGQQLILVYKTAGHKPDELQGQINEEIARIKRYMGYVKEDVDELNASLERDVKELVSKRKEEISNRKKLVNGLGFPVRRKKP